ncbi:hypothetical protein B7495_18675 (plasmid) [Cryobacterium sp. LW097]|uniref:AAA family ATPase n=1 Tax=Cryobacterium sp. LW097 TaxID=1978566 RepID=UPI000B4D84A1|nr:hypothetical protein B7495_18675 [Cryobacterium sp. LW097]
MGYGAAGIMRHRVTAWTAISVDSLVVWAKSRCFVNGIPGAGKSTLAKALGPELGFSVISRDAIKEALADLVTVDMPTQRIGALAADAMWSMVGMIDGPTLVESFWATGRDEEFFKRGLRASQVEQGIELWCEVPRELARSRYIERTRHRVHTDMARLMNGNAW